MHSTSPSTTCATVDAWAGTADSKLFVDVDFLKTMKGTMNADGSWKWVVKKAPPPSLDRSTCNPALPLRNAS